jgi:glycosyltransferase involved in cell wall biosynthesis
VKLIFDARVLTHKSYTGVENYTKYILEHISKNIEVKAVQPKTKNKYLSHLWNHFVLPFNSGNILFCPANIAPFFIPNSKKLIITIHDIAFITQPNSFSLFFRFYYRFIIPINIKRANKIITVSNYSKYEIEKYYPNSENKIEVIYNGYNTKYKVIKNSIKKNQILYVGSMNIRKNFIGILKAYELLNDTKYKLIIVGNFSSNFNLDTKTNIMLNMAKQNPNIEFRNGITDDELVQIYNESKLFIFPSFYEGFGLPVPEAMACGTPVICSDTTSLPEVGGDAVVYCNPNNIEDIKEKIMIVLNDEKLQKQMIQKGLIRAKEFTWEKSAKEHIKVFNMVLKN